MMMMMMMMITKRDIGSECRHDMRLGLVCSRLLSRRRSPVSKRALDMRHVWMRQFFEVFDVWLPDPWTFFKSKLTVHRQYTVARLLVGRIAATRERERERENLLKAAFVVGILLTVKKCNCRRVKAVVTSRDDVTAAGGDVTFSGL